MDLHIFRTSKNQKNIWVGIHRVGIVRVGIHRVGILRTPLVSDSESTLVLK